MSRQHHPTTDCLITQSWLETISYAVLFNVATTNELIGRFHFVAVIKFFLIAIITVGLSQIWFMQKKKKTTNLLSLSVMFECLPTAVFLTLSFIYFFASHRPFPFHLFIPINPLCTHTSYSPLYSAMMVVFLKHRAINHNRTVPPLRSPLLIKIRVNNDNLHPALFFHTFHP